MDGQQWPTGRQTLNAETFVSSIRTSALKGLDKLAGQKMKAEWPTFSATGHVQQVAELNAMIQAHQSGNWQGLDHTWISILFDEGSLIRDLRTMETFLSLGSDGIAGVLGWPVDLVEGPLGTEARLKLNVGMDDVRWLVAFDLKDFEACSVVWRRWQLILK